MSNSAEFGDSFIHVALSELQWVTNCNNLVKKNTNIFLRYEFNFFDWNELNDMEGLSWISSALKMQLNLVTNEVTNWLKSWLKKFTN